jgi:hypothetical protein
MTDFSYMISLTTACENKMKEILLFDYFSLLCGLIITAATTTVFEQQGCRACVP